MLAKFLINNGKIVEGKLGEGPLLDVAQGSGPLYTREMANNIHSLTFQSLIVKVAFVSSCFHSVSLTQVT